MTDGRTVRRRRSEYGEETLSESISTFRITKSDWEFIVDQAGIIECSIPDYIRRLVATERHIHERNRAKSA